MVVNAAQNILDYAKTNPNDFQSLVNDIAKAAPSFSNDDKEYTFEKTNILGYLVYYGFRSVLAKQKNGQDETIVEIVLYNILHMTTLETIETPQITNLILNKIKEIHHTK